MRQVKARMPEAQAQWLREASEATGLSVSELLRSLVAERMMQTGAVRSAVPAAGPHPGPHRSVGSQPAPGGDWAARGTAGGPHPGPQAGPPEGPAGDQPGPPASAPAGPWDGTAPGTADGTAPGTTGDHGAGPPEVPQAGPPAVHGTGYHSGTAPGGTAGGTADGTASVDHSGHDGVGPLPGPQSVPEAVPDGEGPSAGPDPSPSSSPSPPTPPSPSTPPSPPETETSRAGARGEAGRDRAGGHGGDPVDELPEPVRPAVRRWVDDMARLREEAGAVSSYVSGGAGSVRDAVWRQYGGELRRLAEKPEALVHAIGVQLDENPETLGGGKGKRAIRYLAAIVRDYRPAGQGRRRRDRDGDRDGQRTQCGPEPTGERPRLATVRELAERAPRRFRRKYGDVSVEQAERMEAEAAKAKEAVS